MNLSLARRYLADALDSGLQVHGISISGQPAISFDHSNPRAQDARRLFLSTEGLLRDLLRAAMIEHCRKQELPLALDSPAARADLRKAMLEADTVH